MLPRRSQILGPPASIGATGGRAQRSTTHTRTNINGIKLVTKDDYRADERSREVHSMVATGGGKGGKSTRVGCSLGLINFQRKMFESHFVAWYYT